MYDARIQIIGLAGSLGSWAASLVAAVNPYLQTCSLLIGIAVGVWALVDKIKKRRKS